MTYKSVADVKIVDNKIKLIKFTSYFSYNWLIDILNINDLETSFLCKKVPFDKV